jgi:putative acetyltransferase
MPLWYSETILDRSDLHTDHMDIKSITVCLERPQDRAAIRFVNEQAFRRRDEADLIDKLRIQNVVLASFIAEHKKQVVGHILFSRMSIEAAGLISPVPAVALAPVAVLPEQQRQGIGGKLIEHGLDWLRVEGEQVVIVLGDPEYYPRFGFSTDKARALASPFPPEAFMALDLYPRVLDGVHGQVKYPDAFGL